ncbi:response regulator [Sandaracinus amylolyticus]|uniref:Chemotaxis protein methyltransferase CheR n=1 Tax=Sandaracinus amylolyticus TaxID=927083 RepID=A0A0F6W0A4_9BACT|nr:response regulator [Sandaracinus amylolyticus]AKF04008.1 Chemotaxis protein methyltransferase CheR [Sandaracinus amylolyticus]
MLRTARSPLRVLVVEDNEDIADMLALLLERWGHEVTLRRDGRSGLAAGLAGAFDLALLDLGLPELDGFELARQLRAARGAESPVLIAVSGYAQPEDVEEARRAGFDRHVAKPVSERGIRSLLRMARRKKDRNATISIDAEEFRT